MTEAWKIAIIIALIFGAFGAGGVFYVLERFNKPQENVSKSESEQEKDAQIFELRNRVAKLKEEKAVLEMENEEERTIVESWVNGYNKLVKEKAELEAQLKAKEQAQADLQKDYAELKEENTLLCATNSTFSQQLIENGEKYVELKAMYNETKADCDAHWEQLCSIMRTHPEVFPESNGVDDKWEGDKGGIEE